MVTNNQYTESVKKILLISTMLSAFLDIILIRFVFDELAGFELEPTTIGTM